MKTISTFMLFGLVFLLMTAIAGIPFADMQTCELPNGDKVKTRTSRNWYLLKGLNPHGSAWGKETFKSWYVPKEWKSPKVQLLSYQEGSCTNYGYLYGVINIKDMFRLPNTTKFQSGHDLMGVLSYYDDSVDEKMHQKSLLKSEVANSGYVPIETQDEFLWFGLINKSLYYEAPLSNNGEQNAKELVVAVWQSHSTDYGKTWSKPIITKDAKLFVIGKSIKEQPGVAKDKGTLKYIGWF